MSALTGPRRLYLWTGYSSLVLATIGVALPLAPTVPFLLLAAWAFARSDPRVLERLHRNRRFGPLLRNWQAEHAIPTRAKVAAVLMMAGSWALVTFTLANPLLSVVLGAVLGSVALYILTRPVPRVTSASVDEASSPPCAHDPDARP